MDSSARYGQITWSSIMYYQATATINGKTIESGFYFDGRDWAIRMLVRQIGFENLHLITVETM
jgi:hypothetical protein